ncbi:MAG: prephenate dehydratase domain-containing protein [Gemmatimonadaceae bacterium]
MTEESSRARPEAPYVITRGGEPLIVAFQGERGAYGDLAIERLWGAGARRLTRRDVEGVVLAVAVGAAGFAVLPVHNEIIGEIPGVQQAIGRSGLSVHGYVTVPVRHCLLARPGATLASVRTVFSHSAALDQCGGFLRRHPWMRRTASYDTAGAAREVAVRGQESEGAIASEECAARYGLDILARDVGDRDDNATRFAVLALHPETRTTA